MRTLGTLSSLIALGALSALSGCGGGGSSSSARSIGATTSGTTGATTTAPTTTAQAPRPPVLLAVDLDARGERAAQGDTITLSFSEEVMAPAGDDAAAHLALLVAGDDFGAGATIGSGLNATQLVVTLGASPNLRVTGAFDVADVGSGAASGIALLDSARIAGASGVAAIGTSDLTGNVAEVWSGAGALTLARGCHTATLLDDGRILVVGGLTKISNPNAGLAGQPAMVSTAVAAAELFDPVARASAPAGVMAVPVTGGALVVSRYGHTATKLLDGRVLIVGGRGAEGGDAAPDELSAVHLFDPATDTFSFVGRLQQGRQRHTATLLRDGRVLIAGGYAERVLFTPPPAWGAAPVLIDQALRSVELFDPATGAFSPFPTDVLLDPRMDAAAFLDDATGRVVVAGGAARIPQQTPPAPTTPGGPPSPISSVFAFDLAKDAEAVDPVTALSQRTAGAPTVAARYRTAAGLPGGPVLLIGGHEDRLRTVVGDVEVWTGAGFAPVTSLSVARARAEAVALDGREVLVAGGVKYQQTAGDELASCEVVDVALGQVRAAPAMATARNSFALVRTPDGRVYAVGGFVNDPDGTVLGERGQALSEVEVYNRP